MFTRNRQLKLQQYRISEIKESDNNRLVDIGDSFLALLAEVPDYDHPVKNRSAGLVVSIDSGKINNPAVSKSSP